MIELGKTAFKQLIRSLKAVSSFAGLSKLVLVESPSKRNFKETDTKELIINKQVDLYETVTRDCVPIIAAIYLRLTIFTTFIREENQIGFI